MTNKLLQEDRGRALSKKAGDVYGYIANFSIPIIKIGGGAAGAARIPKWLKDYPNSWNHNGDAAFIVPRSDWHQTEQSIHKLLNSSRVDKIQVREWAGAQCDGDTEWFHISEKVQSFFMEEDIDLMEQWRQIRASEFKLQECLYSYLLMAQVDYELRWGYEAEHIQTRKGVQLINKETGLVLQYRVMPDTTKDFSSKMETSILLVVEGQVEIIDKIDYEIDTFISPEEPSKQTSEIEDKLKDLVELQLLTYYSLIKEAQQLQRETFNEMVKKWVDEPYFKEMNEWHIQWDKANKKFNDGLQQAQNSIFPWHEKWFHKQNIRPDIRNFPKPNKGLIDFKPSDFPPNPDELKELLAYVIGKLGAFLEEELK